MPARGIGSKPTLPVSGQEYKPTKYEREREERSRREAARMAANARLAEANERDETVRRCEIVAEVNGRQDTTRQLHRQAADVGDQEARWRLLLGRATGDLDEALCLGHGNVESEWAQIGSVVFERLAWQAREEAQG